MTNGQHKFQMKSKVKVKPYCFMEGKKIKVYINYPEQSRI